MLSKTQATNYLSLAGAIVVILGYFKVQININDLATLIGALATILGIVLNFVNRYKKGDVTMMGIIVPETVDNTASTQG